MTAGHFEYRFRPPLSRPEGLGAPPAEYVRTEEAGLLIERNVAVKLRDGVSILVDVFRDAM
jgi:hypothetical protein